MKNLILIIAILMSSFSSLFSQDKIELKSGEILEVTITKIGLEDIEFRPYALNETAIIKLSKFFVKSYEFENTQSVVAVTAEKFANIEVKDLYDKEFTRIYKTNPLIMATSGSYKFAVEQSLSYDSSIEFEVGLKNRSLAYMGAETSGTYVNSTIRYKLYYRPASVKATDYGKSALQGFYIAPLVTLGTSEKNDFFFSDGSFSSTGNNANFYAGAMLDLGYQFVARRMAVDFFTGFGFVANSENGEYSLNQTHVSGGIFAFRTGARIGINTK